MTSAILVSNITPATALYNGIGYSIAVIILIVITLSVLIAWKAKRYRLLLAMSLFKISLIFNFTISAISSWAFYVDPSQIYVAPFTGVRTTLIVLSLCYLFYSLWWRNGKTGKLVNVVDSLTDNKKQ